MQEKQFHFLSGGHVSWRRLALLNGRGEFRTTAIRKTPDIRNAVKTTIELATAPARRGRTMSAHAVYPVTPGP